MSAGPRRIDAHLHLWDLAVSEYAWLTPELGTLYNSWTPQQAATELQRAGISGAVLVQAEDTRVDTEYLLDVASEQPWVLGVVGWIQLDDPHQAGLDLERWLEHTAFCGARHLINDDPRADFLDLAPVRSSLKELARAGIPFDVHDAWPRHLRQAVQLADELPQLTLVLDHLGKPPHDTDSLHAWQLEMAALAARPNTVVKFSGLHTKTGPVTGEMLRRAWHTALENFGPERIMYGGDWPITVPGGGYQPAWHVSSQLIDELAPAEQANILSGTAARVYDLPGSAPLPL